MGGWVSGWVGKAGGAECVLCMPKCWGGQHKGQQAADCVRKMHTSKVKMHNGNGSRPRAAAQLAGRTCGAHSRQALWGPIYPVVDLHVDEVPAAGLAARLNEGLGLSNAAPLTENHHRLEVGAQQIQGEGAGVAQLQAAALRHVWLGGEGGGRWGEGGGV